MDVHFKVDDQEFMMSLKKYLGSIFFSTTPDYAKSEYWKEHSSAINIELKNDGVFLSGRSGNYIPSVRTWRSIIEKIKTYIKSPLRILNYVKERYSKNYLLSYIDAFEMVMNHDPKADIDLSPWRINFLKLKTIKNVMVSIQEIKTEYSRINPSAAFNDLILLCYYHRNFLIANSCLFDSMVILDIGAGNGNLVSLIKYKLLNLKVIVVDLPETLCLSMVYLKHIFPKAKVLMPHEAENERNILNYDMIFLTPQQINKISANSVDLAINTCSFQEMKREQIEVYFQLIQNVCKHNAFFYTYNRVEKIPTGSLKEISMEPPNRFFDYPWYSDNKTIIYEIDRVSRLSCYDDHCLRLEQIQKNIA